MKNSPCWISALQLERARLPDARFEFLLHLLEQRLEPLEVLAFWRLAISSAARLSALVRTCRSSVMSAAPASHPELGQQFVIVDRLVGALPSRLPRPPAALDDPAAQAATRHSVKRAQAVEAHGIQPLENVAVFPMLRGAAVLLDKPLNLLESGDDALLARRAAALLLRLREVVQFASAVRRGRGHS